MCAQQPRSTMHQHRGNSHRRDGRRPADKGCTEPLLVMRLHGAAQGSFVIAPRSCVYSLPEGTNGHGSAAADFITCPAFSPANPEASCPMGSRCHFVHVDTAHVKDHPIHVNYAWRSLEDVTYDRYLSGHRLEVAPPNFAVTADVMDSGLVLKTKALTSTRRTLSHCAHYYFNRTCNLGAECRFVHAVFLDPTAKDHQRAPAPVQLGRSAPTSVAGDGVPHQLWPNARLAKTTAAVCGADGARTSPVVVVVVVDGVASAAPTTSVSRRNSAVEHAAHELSAQAHPRPRQHRPYEAIPLPASDSSAAASGATTTSTPSSTTHGTPVTSPMQECAGGPTTTATANGSGFRR